MRRPASTYRLQLRPDFGFAEARDVVPYLDRLGVDTLYLSPIAEAVPGSEHGYDVTDPTRIRAELGGEEGLHRLAVALRERDMGLLLDIVPNHMAADAHHNGWWRDVLRYGSRSRFAPFFDIDWGAEERLVLPVLGHPLEEVLARGEIRLAHGGREEATPVLRYFEHEFPVAPGTVASDGADLGPLIDRQNYRLAHWRTGAAEVNYRRFFDISHLVSLRVEDPVVFEATHALVRRLVTDGVVDGLRVDHVDGLLDPGAYLRRLQEVVFGGEPGYVVVEKILAPGERLPADWPVEGTTGYDFLNTVNGLVVDPEGVDAMGRAYTRFTGVHTSFEDVVFERKIQVQRELFAAERDRLVRRLVDLGLGGDVEAAVTAVTAALPRYRTYFSRALIRQEDRRVVAAALAVARTRRPLSGEVYDGLERLLTLQGYGREAVPEDDPVLDVVLRWQQYSGPVMAKGFEDTALYVYNRLVSANAVGGDPGSPSASRDDFHALCRDRVRHPGAINATSTHDGKRSEDVRARIDVLTREPAAWEEALERWSAGARRHRGEALGAPVPSRNLEFLAWQTVAGAWPLQLDEEDDFVERLGDYLLKAAREAKTHTSWRERNEAYESALAGWATAIGDDADIREDVRTFVRRTAPAGLDASLVQLVLKLTAPGVPDVYRGAELWDFSLVDPDNRRPVDFGERARMLEALAPLLEHPNPEDVRELRSRWRGGGVKLYVTAALLRRRRADPGLYRDGDFRSLDGAAILGGNDTVCAFERRAGSRRLVVAAALGGTIDSARLELSAAPGARFASYANVLTGRKHPGAVLPLTELLATLPVAVLEARESTGGGG